LIEIKLGTRASNGGWFDAASKSPRLAREHAQVNTPLVARSDVGRDFAAAGRGLSGSAIDRLDAGGLFTVVEQPDNRPEWL
jgi:hypothetical protein